MRNSIQTLAAVAFASTLITGCASTAARYQEPVMRLPADFTTASGAFAPVPVETTAWWQAFEDPVLDALVAAALAANGDLQASLSRLEAATERTMQASRARFPTGGPDARRDITGENDSDGRRAGFDAGLELDVFGRIRNSLRAVEARQGATEAQFDDTRLVIAASTARTYFEFRGTSDRVRLLEEFVADQAAVAELTLARVEEGRNTDVDLNRARAQLAADRAALALERYRAEITEHALAVLVGELPGQWRVPQQVRLAPLSMREIAIGDPGALLERRPDVRAAERQLAAAMAEIGVARARLFPQIRLSGGLGYAVGSSAVIGEERDTTWRLTPTISWALLDLKGVRAGIRASEAEAAAALATYEQTVRRALGDAEDALAGYGMAQERLGELVSQASHAGRAAELALILYEEGETDYLAALDASRIARMAETALVDGLVTQRTATIAVHEALGSMPAR